MVSLCLNSLLPLPPSHPHKLVEPSSSSLLSTSNEVALKPIVMDGDPPTIVSAPARRIIAVGDLHGDLGKTRDALQLAGVLSSDGRDQWIGQDTVLVHVGDILDRGDDEIAILSLLRSLDDQAKANGGAVFQVSKILQDTLQAVGAKAMVVGHSPQLSGVNWYIDRTFSQKLLLMTRFYNEIWFFLDCGIWRVDVGMSSGVLDSTPEVLEMKGDKARVIRSNQDRLHELQIADYI